MKTTASNPIASSRADASAPNAPSDRHRGMVIVVVLVVIAALALTAYRYSDTMLTEYKASQSLHRSVQTKHLADSGINYAAAMLRDVTNNLNGNVWNNPEAFRGITVKTELGDGKFSLICPGDPEDPTTTYQYGCLDEGGKINLNAMMTIDPTGTILQQMLLALPNMTEEIANSIIDWMDADSDALPGGAENDYYMALSPPYRCKNGPIDSIDELLLVQGVTRDLLYGSDVNRNFFQDQTDPISNGFVRGWASFLTVQSREQNRDIDGNNPVYLNNTDLQNKIYAILGPQLDGVNGGPELVNFIILYRQYGPGSASTGGTQSLGSTITSLLGGGSMSNAGGSGSGSSSGTVQGDLTSYTLDFTKQANYTFTTVYDLIGTQVNIKSGSGKTAVTTVYTSPLNDPTVQQTLLPSLFNYVTMTDDTTPEIPARININTAPREVLMALIPNANGNLAETDVDNIIAARPKLSTQDMPDPSFQSPGWLMTSQAQITQAAMTALAPYITTRTQVYRVQSVGYYDGKGPAIRIEAVIDTNPGPNGPRPRIIAWRDLSELGKGFDDTVP